MNWAVFHAFKMIKTWLAVLTILNCANTINGQDLEFGEHWSKSKSWPGYHQTPHYAISLDNAKALAIVEETLVTNLIPILDSFQAPSKCSRSFTNYLTEFQVDSHVWSDKTGYERASLIVENPFLLYKMIRRLVVTLFTNTVRECHLEYKMIEEVVNMTFFKTKIQPPSHTDLDEAATGILRIQYVYGINATSELYLGTLNGVDMGICLHIEDCLDLSDMAVEHNLYHLAAQWLSAAELLIPTLESEEVERKMWALGRIDKAWEELGDILKIEDKNVLVKELIGQKQLHWDGYHDYENYSVCRGEVKDKKLTCFYEHDRDHYFIINPLKVEVLSEDPQVYQFHGVIMETAIQSIRDAIYGQLARSSVIRRSKPGQQVFDLARTSINGWVLATEEYLPNKRLQVLGKLTEKITGLKVFTANSSELQVVKYGSLGGHYEFHDDALQDSPQPLPTGDRIATFMMFLSDVRMGGFTGFPYIGAFCRPVKGSAVLWYNLKQNGKRDPRLKHGGCPVIMGQKEVANRWIMELENVWTFPCKKV